MEMEAPFYGSLTYVILEINVIFLDNFGNILMSLPNTTTIS